MAIKRTFNTLNSLHVISKNNSVFIKSKTNEDEWHPINFQWIPVVKLNETMNQ